MKRCIGTLAASLSHHGANAVRACFASAGNYRVTTIAGKIPTRTVVWFDPAQEFAPVRFESSLRDPENPNEWRDPIESGRTTWKQIGGVWFPETCTRKAVGTADGNKSTRTLRFHWLAINQPVEDRPFAVEDLALREGTLLVDSTQGRQMIYQVSNGRLQQWSSRANPRVPRP